MIKNVVFVAVAIFALQGVIAKPKAKPAEKSQLQELAANAQTIVNNVTSAIEGNLPDSKQVVEALNTQAQTLANHVQTAVDKIKTEVKNNQGEIDTALKTVSDKLSEVAANLKSALGPEGQKQAQEIKAKLDKGLKDAVAQAEKLTKAIEPEAAKVKEDLSNATKTFLDQIIEVGNNLREQVKTLEKPKQ
ncbi:uncharacterized protein LOC111691543 [Anoplophora glabripennis]|uniref:uncharacterized protein LOC108908598 n=1 Tax=Anoplophora glabripennis TaxID=217634 RepID=UPI000874C048|nr:uncharacterized protein LOC108908598 [Anoplophora glabripennis]XP_023310348.1 uncharacterized protein LOC111691543 [Anoplophora glabripennis]